MKIIFDSENEKNSFFTHVASDYCPGIFGLKNTGCIDIGHGRESNYDCDSCWENCGLEMEVLDQAKTIYALVEEVKLFDWERHNVVATSFSKGYLEILLVKLKELDSKHDSEHPMPGFSVCYRISDCGMVNSMDDVKKFIVSEEKE